MTRFRCSDPPLPPFPFIVLLLSLLLFGSPSTVTADLSRISSSLSSSSSSFQLDVSQQSDEPTPQRVSSQRTPHAAALSARVLSSNEASRNNNGVQSLSSSSSSSPPSWLSSGVRVAVFYSNSVTLTPALNSIINVTASSMNAMLLNPLVNNLANDPSLAPLTFDFYNVDIAPNKNVGTFVYNILTSPHNTTNTFSYQLFISPFTTGLDTWTLTLAGVSNLLRIPMITASNGAVTLEDKTQFPYVIQSTLDDDKALASVVAEMHVWGWRRLGGLIQANTKGMSYAALFSATTALSFTPVLIDFSSTVPTLAFMQHQQQQVQAAIQQMLALGLRVFYILCDNNNGIGYFVTDEFMQLGLFQQNYVIFGTPQFMTDAYFSTWNTLASSLIGGRTHSLSDLNGNVGGALHEGSGLWNTPAFQQQVLPLTTPNFYPFLQFMGDGIIATAQIIYNMATNATPVASWSTSNFLTFANGVMFHGLTGQSQLDRLYTLVPSYRLLSVEKGVLVIKGSLYPNGSSSVDLSSFTWPSQTSVSPLDHTLITTSLLFISDPYLTAVRVFVGVMASISIALHVFLFVFREHRVVKSSSHFFCQTTVLGSWPAYAALLLYSYKDNNEVPASCLLVPALFALSFDLTFGAMCVKTFRIYRIFMSSKICMLKISDFDLAFPILVAVIGDAIIMTVWSTTWPSSPSLLSTDATTGMISAASQSQWWSCVSWKQGLFLVTLVLPKVVVLFGCTYLAYGVRNVESSFNESRYLGICIYTTILISIIVLPALLLIPYSLVEIHMLLYLFVCFGLVTLPQCVLLLPKLYAIYTNAQDSPRVRRRRYTPNGGEVASRTRKRNVEPGNINDGSGTSRGVARGISGQRISLSTKNAAVRCGGGGGGGADQQLNMRESESGDESSHTSSLFSELGIDFTRVNTHDVAERVVTALFLALKRFPKELDQFRNFLSQDRARHRSSDTGLGVVTAGSTSSNSRNCAPVLPDVVMMSNAHSAPITTTAAAPAASSSSACASASAGTSAYASAAVTAATSPFFSPITPTRGLSMRGGGGWEGVAGGGRIVSTGQAPTQGIAPSPQVAANHRSSESMPYLPCEALPMGTLQFNEVNTPPASSRVLSQSQRSSANEVMIMMGGSGNLTSSSSNLVSNLIFTGSSGSSSNSNSNSNSSTPPRRLGTTSYVSTPTRGSSKLGRIVKLHL